MQAVYNFHWESSYSNLGVSHYILTVNGSQNTVYSNSIQIAIEENTYVHAEVVAVDVNGQVSDPATMDFQVPAYDYGTGNDRPTVPGNFGADFQYWQ